MKKVLVTLIALASQHVASPAPPATPAVPAADKK